MSASAQNRLASEADYHKYIDPLLEVKVFGTHYLEDSAADAAVLVPFERSSTFHHEGPSEPVIELIHLGPKSVPLLIDCLDDGRITTVRFEGNTIRKPRDVPVGYVCLDIQTASIRGKSVSDLECNSDGLGACMSTFAQTITGTAGRTPIVAACARGSMSYSIVGGSNSFRICYISSISTTALESLSTKNSLRPRSKRETQRVASTVMGKLASLR